MNNKKDFTDWEALLKSEWLWDIDETEWFETEITPDTEFEKEDKKTMWDFNEIAVVSKENIRKIISIQLDENENLWIKLKYFWTKHNIDIETDTENRKIVFIDKISKKIIWEMYNWVYVIWDITYEHNWLEINKQHRKKWLWQLIFELYEEIFWLLDEEFTRKFNTYIFYKKNWYSRSYLIKEDTLETIIPEDDNEIKSLLQKLWYTLVMTKNKK